MAALLSLLFSGGKGTKIMVIGLLIFAVAVGTFVTVEVMQIRHLNKQLSELTADNALLKSNNQVLETNQKALAQANATNYMTAQKLVEERSEAKAAIDALAKANAHDKKSLEAISAKIDEMLKDPANNGPVAPVLKETIREIQQARSKK